MIDYGKVTSTVAPQPKVIDEYSVWINTDIKEISTTMPEKPEELVTLYQYNQVQYDKDEYIGMIDDKNAILEAQVTDTQLAIVEVYESILTSNTVQSEEE